VQQHGEFVDHVIAPAVRLRQWVLTVPLELRLLLAAAPAPTAPEGSIQRPRRNDTLAARPRPRTRPVADIGSGRRRRIDRTVESIVLGRSYEARG
jgi:hypothetical protein